MLSRLPFRPRTLVALALLALVFVIVAVGKLLGGNTPTITPHNDSNPPLSTVDPTSGNDGLDNIDTSPTAVVPSNSTEALAVATSFAKRWIDHNRDAKVWRDSLLPQCTKALAAELAGVDPESVPADRITGDAAIEAHAESYVDVIIPIDAGKLRLRLVAPQGKWLVDGIDWERV